MDYDEARRRAMAAVDAVSRRDLDALQAGVHEEATHQSPFVDRHLGQEDGRIVGKEAHREFVRWLWTQEPQMHSVLEEVFTGHTDTPSWSAAKITAGRLSSFTR